MRGQLAEHPLGEGLQCIVYLARLDHLETEVEADEVARDPVVVTADRHHAERVVARFDHADGRADVMHDLLGRGHHLDACAGVEDAHSDALGDKRARVRRRARRVAVAGRDQRADAVDAIRAPVVSIEIEADS